MEGKIVCSVLWLFALLLATPCQSAEQIRASENLTSPEAAPANMPQSATPETQPASTHNLITISYRLDLQHRNIIFAPMKLNFGQHEQLTDKETTIVVPPCPAKEVKNEKLLFQPDYTATPTAILSNCQGNRFSRLAIPGVVIPGSIILKADSQNSQPKMSECKINDNFGVITTKSARAGSTANMLVDYSINQNRVDTIVIQSGGTVRLLEGTPVNWAPQPPDVPNDAYPLVNVYSSSAKPLAASDVLPILSPQSYLTPETRVRQNVAALKGFLSKLQPDRTVKITFWGDSVTLGSDTTSDIAMFTNRVLSGLTQRYPECHIHATNLGRGGANTLVRYKQLASEVLADHPDLVVVEFLNDMTLPVSKLHNIYASMIEQVRQSGADLMFCIPHIPLTTFIPEVSTTGAGSKAYIQLLRNLEREHQGQVAFVDVAAWSEHLGRIGLKPESFLVDGIHPSDAGHKVYADLILQSLVRESHSPAAPLPQQHP